MEWQKKLYEQPLVFQAFTLDKSLLGPMSPWTKVFLDYCPLDKVVIGQLSLVKMYQHRFF